MRSIICVVAGFVVVMAAFVAGTAAATELIVPGGLMDAAIGPRSELPQEYFAAKLVVTAVGAVLGGWVTARMAPSMEMAHVGALAVLVLLMALPGLLGYGDAQMDQPVWFIYLLPVFGISAAILGGWLRSRVVVKP